MKKILIIVIIAVGLLLGGLWWSNSIERNDPDIISRKGLHWHPKLFIYVNGEIEMIPGNIGIGESYAGLPSYDPAMRMTGIHTHDDANQGIIHFEFQGVVERKDLTLGQFLKVWEKDINSFGSNVRMTVNGKESTEYESYFMQDGDKIELRYE